jgi:DNA-binding transcriptional MerR regulator
MTLRTAGISVEDIRRYVDLFHQGPGTIPERKQMLEDQLSELKTEAEKLNEVIRRLEGIIDNYEETLMKRELTSRKEDPFYG